MVPDGTTAGEPAAVLMKVRSSADGGPVSKYKRDPKRVSLFSVYPGGLYLAGFALRRVLSPDFGETRERETVVSLREKNKTMRESSAVMVDTDGHVSRTHLTGAGQMKKMYLARIPPVGMREVRSISQI